LSWMPALVAKSVLLFPNLSIVRREQLIRGQ
jgi:hypothetical protein